jgi:hypothetical protein
MRFVKASHEIIDSNNGTVESLLNALTALYRSSNSAAGRKMLRNWPSYAQTLKIEADRFRLNLGWIRNTRPDLRDKLDGAEAAIVSFEHDCRAVVARPYDFRQNVKTPVRFKS